MSRTAHRATWPALLLTLITSLIVSAPAHAARSTGDPGGTGGTGGERIWRPLVCTYTDEEVKAEAETVKSEAGVLTLDSHIICWLAAESTPTNPVEQAIMTPSSPAQGSPSMLPGSTSSARSCARTARWG